MDQSPLTKKYNWDSPLDALSQAVDMEKQVTQRIKRIIDYCSAAEDHHVSFLLILLFLLLLLFLLTDGCADRWLIG